MNNVLTRADVSCIEETETLSAESTTVVQIHTDAKFLLSYTIISWLGGEWKCIVCAGNWLKGGEFV